MDASVIYASQYYQYQYQYQDYAEQLEVKVPYQMDKNKKCQMFAAGIHELFLTDQFGFTAAQIEKKGHTR